MDQTGQPGPATWQAGDFPERQDDYPVSGISWYEAAAYAEFAGKSLPTGEHWGTARGEHTTLIQVPQLGGFAILAPFSNFTGRGPVPVGSLPGITAYGAFDMAGNVLAKSFLRIDSLGVPGLGEIENFAKQKPVPDSVFQVYKEQFSYDKTDLKARVE